MSITLTEITAGSARVLLDGQDIGIVEKTEHTGRIIHTEHRQEDNPSRDHAPAFVHSTAEGVSRMMWAFTPKHLELTAITLNRGVRHIAEGHRTRREAVDALVADHQSA